MPQQLPTASGDGAVRRMRRLALILTLGCLAAFVAVAAAANTQPGLDRSYGTDGVVKIPPPVPGDNYGSYSDFEGFTAAADGDAFVFGRGGGGAREHELILRFNHAGRRDGAYGGRGVLTLPSSPNGYTAFADRKARVVTGTRLGGRVLLRRFTYEGHPDRSFGKGGVVSVPCDCDGTSLRLFEIGDGRILVDLSRELDRGEDHDVATSLRLIELLPDGRLDRRFGRAGSLAFKIPRPGPPRVVAPTPTGAILLGGPARAGSGPIYLWRVNAAGRVDGAFVRHARLSIRRMGALGRRPELGAIVPTAGGGVAALGSVDETSGFFLRLRADGEPDRSLGGRGVRRLPFTVQSALGGAGSAIFAVGYGHHGYDYRAFRVFPDGSLDPRYLGAKGRDIPLRGVGVHVLSQGSGRVLVADKGRTYCRSGCGPNPSMARFRE
jgi:hypothetical protein